MRKEAFIWKFFLNVAVKLLVGQFVAFLILAVVWEVLLDGLIGKMDRGGRYSSFVLGGRSANVNSCKSSRYLNKLDCFHDGERIVSFF